MKAEKRNQLKQKIENAKEELEKLKAMNPYGNYEDIENFIKNMDYALDESNFRKGYGFVIFLKLFIIVIFSYILCTASVCIVFGFTHSLLNPIASEQFIRIVPLTSFVLFIALRSMNYASNKMTNQHPLFFMGLIYIVVIIVFAFIDNLYFHICISLDKSFLMATLLLITASVVDMIYTRKVYFGI
ncbi:MAG: hypothetical protein K2N64_01565 [Anaeroplasmataceae bacterium]|nr:hypothetical protein [Anaeroplasmataceae bacterium]